MPNKFTPALVRRGGLFLVQRITLRRLLGLSLFLFIFNSEMVGAKLTPHLRFLHRSPMITATKASKNEAGE